MFIHIILSNVYLHSNTYLHNIAYAFALVGDPKPDNVPTHLAAIDLLRKSGSMLDILSVQNYNTINGLNKALHDLKAKPYNVDKNLTCNCRQNLFGMIFGNYRFAFSCYILNIWKMTEYKKILYMDGDLAVLQNPDQLFIKWSYENTTELRTPQACNSYIGNDYNTGVWGITPSSDTFNGMKTWLNAADYPCGIGSQTWVNMLFTNHTYSNASLLWNMKADQGVKSCLTKYNIQEHPHIVHWSGNRKPTSGLVPYDKYEARALLLYMKSVNLWTEFINRHNT